MRATTRWPDVTTTTWFRLPRSLPRDGFWALADQGVVSLGTFLTSVLLARTLAPAEYGAFMLIFGTVLFLNSVQGSLIGFPLSIKGATADRDGLQQFTSTALALTSATALVLGVVVVLASIAVQRPEVAPWAVASMLLWQWQDCLRRALMAHVRHRDAIWGDALSFLGQAAILWLVSRIVGLTSELAFALVALTSGLSALVQSAQVGLRRPTMESLRLHALEFWILGRWLALSNFTSILTNQAFPWTLAYFHGLAASAEFQATANILGMTHPVLFSMSNLVVPAVARARSRQGMGVAWRTGSMYGAQAGLLLAPVFVVLMVWPDRVLATFYGSESPYAGLDSMLRLFVIVYCFRYGAFLVSAVLRGIEDGRGVFLGKLAGAAAALVLGLPLAALSVVASIGGAALSAASEVAVTAYLLRRAL